MPILAILGSNDERVPRAEALHGQLPQTEIVIVPGHGHGDVVGDTLFGQAVARFYREHAAARGGLLPY